MTNDTDEGVTMTAAPLPATPNEPETTTPAAISAGLFRQVLGQYPTGVCVVTAMHPDGEAVGMTIGSFASVSLQPALVGFMADRASSSWARLRECGRRFCVNILSEAQEDIGRIIAARKRNKFDGLSWHTSPTGLPVLTDSCAYIDCVIEDIFPAGDHEIVLGRALHLDVVRPFMPLLFFRGGYGSFTPLTISAGDTDVVEQLRYVDVVKPVMENLADKLQSEVTVITRVGDELAVIATVGRAKTAVVPTRVGQRVSFMPPLGGVHAAWADEQEQQAWLRRLPEGHDRATYEQILRTIRKRGYSFGIGHAANAALEEAITAGRGDVGLRVDQAVRGVLGLYNIASLDAGKAYEFHSVTAPVFAGERGPQFTFTLWGPAGVVGVDVISRYTRELLAATRRASELLGADAQD
jgi:flavin reductase (DIM6/NTAB) family NADH-FMN oxidoreductase RutF/DNA-binding IclR family transcriptional regulator